MLTAKNCNFQTIGGEPTGTYRFITRYYGLTVMPKDFQKILNNLSAKFSKAFVFIDDNLFETEGNKEEHLAKVRENLQTLNEANLLLKATKCKFATKERVAWVQVV